MIKYCECCIGQKLKHFGASNIQELYRMNQFCPDIFCALCNSTGILPGSKLRSLGEFNGHKGWAFYCPGCKEHHGFNDSWSFDGNMENPTVSPSLLTTLPSDPAYRCHLFIKNGKIEYLSDCHHELAGQTIDMMEINDEDFL